MYSKSVSTSLVLLFLLSAFPGSAGATDVLKTAKDIGAKLASEDYGYPHANCPPKPKTIDCTAFVLKVAQALVPDLPATAKTRILMSDLAEVDVVSDKDGIVSNGDSRTRGIQEALTAINHGKVVRLQDATAGDLVQYWMKQSDGTWFGHSGVIAEVKETNGVRRAWLYGSHKSTCGIGIAPDVGLRLITANDRVIHIVRFE